MVLGKRIGWEPLGALWAYLGQKHERWKAVFLWESYLHSEAVLTPFWGHSEASLR